MQVSLKNEGALVKREGILKQLEETQFNLDDVLRDLPDGVEERQFEEELEKFGKIYMYRFKPNYKIQARSIANFPHNSKQAASIMLMIHNNLDDSVAQHPDELITYGGNGSVFQNWAQYLLTMQYLSEMTNKQTLVLYSGHPLGLFPSNKNAPRVVITNGMMIPNYSKPKDLEKLGVQLFTDMKKGVKDCDIVMMLRLQNERMQGSFLPSKREYYEFFGLTPEKLKYANKDALIMHPGPMNRGVEIDTKLADDINVSLVKEQVELGVAVRMACLKIYCK